ncbi:MAG: aspartate aminotransferase family protein, partial [Altibacter sp.]|nr:aspartate aminotransferase family protein [Altibacter sp.]
EYLHRGLAKVLAQHSIPHTINRVGSMISVHFSEIPVTNFETAAQANNKAFKTFFHGMLSEGIYIAPSAFETWFLSEALTYEDLDATIAACGRIAPRLT